jgi:hypothetical protein
MADFFPTKDADLLPWLKNFSTALTAGAAAWDILPAEASTFATKVSAYEVVYDEAVGENRSRPLVIAKNRMKKQIKDSVRTIKNRYLDYNDAVTEEDRARLGLPVHDRDLTPKPAPVSVPVLEVVPRNNRQHTVTALNQKTGKKQKPEDAHGVRFVWEIRDTVPVDAGDLRGSVFRVGTRVVFDYREAERGKRVFYAACYENGKGYRGAWSDIVEAVIP